MCWAMSCQARPSATCPPGAACSSGSGIQRANLLDRELSHGFLGCMRRATTSARPNNYPGLGGSSPDIPTSMASCCISSVFKRRIGRVSIWQGTAGGRSEIGGLCYHIGTLDLSCGAKRVRVSSLTRNKEIRVCGVAHTFQLLPGNWGGARLDLITRHFGVVGGLTE